MNLKLSDICRMCGGELSKNSNPELVLTDVVIDSRVVVDGTLFVAIKGENSDGHDYVASVVANYHAAALVDKKIKPGISHLILKNVMDPSLCLDDNPVEDDSNWSSLPNLIYVEDTVKALGLLAENYRKMFTLPVIAITGSNGKTTVKEMLKNICGVKFGAEHVLATTGNLNNHLGVPLTLLGLTEAHQVAIIEMGMNHSGELDYLSRLAAPTIAVVNNVMLAHAGFFNDLTDIAKAKGEIFNGLVAGGTAYINTNIPEHAIWLEQLQQHRTNYTKYGEEQSGYFLKKLAKKSSANEFTIVTPQGYVDITLQVLGEHNQKNALTAAILALQVGCSLNDVKRGLENYSGYKGRLEKKKAFNGAEIIDDSYNANPDSVKAAINAIANLPRPHWFLFADLKELGKFELSAHEEIGKYAVEHNVDVLLTYGDLAKIALNTFSGESLSFDSRDDMIKYCLKNLPSKATLLVKGSNSMKLSEVIRELVTQKV